MTLGTFDFVRRFLIHVLPKGLHRIRHYGLFAKGSCADNIARARQLLAALRYARLLKTLSRVDLLILDDWGLAPLTGEQRRDLLEVVDNRHQRGSTIITSQVPIENWHEVIADSTIADAVLDRLVHNAHRLALKGDSLRKITAQRATLDATKKT
jgi:DNA replication protein DnaC